MTTTVKNVAIKFGIESVSSNKTAIDGLRNDVNQYGDAWKQNSTAIINALNGVEKATQNVSTKIENQRTVTEKDGKLMIQQYELLNQAVNKTFGSVAAAPEAIQQAFHTAEEQFKTTTEKVKEMTSATTDQSQAIKGNAAEWGGWAQQFQKLVTPAQATFIIKMGAVAEALKAGWEAGTKFAEVIGTNFDAAESAAKNLKESFAGVTNAFTSGGLEDGMNHLIAAVTHLGDTLLDNGDAMKGFNALAAAGVDRVKALTLSTDDLRKVSEAYTAAQDAGTEGLKLFDDTVHKTDPTQLGNALEALKGKFKELGDQAKITADLEEARKKGLAAVVSTIQAEIDKLEAEKIARAKGVEAIQNEILERENYKKALESDIKAQELAKNVHGGLTDSMVQELAHLAELIPTYEKNTDRVKTWADALKADIALHADGIEPAYKKQLQALVDLIDGYGKTADATKGAIELKLEEIQRSHAAAVAVHEHSSAIIQHTGSLKEGTIAISNLDEKQEKLVKTFGDSSAATKVAADGIYHLGESFDATQIKLGAVQGTFSEIGKTADASKLSISGMAAELHKLNTELEGILVKADAAAKGIKLVGDAATHASGSGGGIDYPNVHEEGAGGPEPPIPYIPFPSP